MYKQTKTNKMKKFTLITKEKGTLNFNTYKELEDVLNTIEKVVSKKITIKLFNDNVLQVSTSYFWNSTNWEMISNDIKTY